MFGLLKPREIYTLLFTMWKVLKVSDFLSLNTLNAYIINFENLGLLIRRYVCMYPFQNVIVIFLTGLVLNRSKILLLLLQNNCLVDKVVLPVLPRSIVPPRGRVVGVL